MEKVPTIRTRGLCMAAPQSQALPRNPKSAFTGAGDQKSTHYSGKLKQLRPMVGPKCRRASCDPESIVLQKRYPWGPAAADSRAQATSPKKRKLLVAPAQAQLQSPGPEIQTSDSSFRSPLASHTTLRLHTCFDLFFDAVPKLWASSLCWYPPTLCRCHYNGGGEQRCLVSVGEGHVSTAPFLLLLQAAFQAAVPTRRPPGPLQCRVKMVEVGEEEDDEERGKNRLKNWSLLHEISGARTIWV